ncbi:hypothetical protein CLOSTMETH_03802 [[Clostridium] methylpentosum DSM 5476]|uniref:Uncharacterized protein n=1 Tax=[Clostridium] methylpentosum DSM 5476 TaxID=537013 RepID=C0EIV7_9FIRM|nr:hypothetical protein CLOSTMETH_03802 [[Clostridium] methylpentosum DSM 5476]
MPWESSLSLFCSYKYAVPLKQTLFQKSTNIKLSNYYQVFINNNSKYSKFNQ